MSIRIELDKLKIEENQYKITARFLSFQDKPVVFDKKAAL